MIKTAKSSVSSQTKEANKLAAAFIEAWQTSECVADVEAKVPQINNVRGMAVLFRKNNIELKAFRRVTKYDYPYLAKLAKEYLSAGRTQTIRN